MHEKTTGKMLLKATTFTIFYEDLSSHVVVEINTFSLLRKDNILDTLHGHINNYNIQRNEQFLNNFLLRIILHNFHEYLLVI